MEDQDILYNASKVKNEVIDEYANRLIEWYIKSEKSEIAIVCIGSVGFIGDSVGPLVGTILEKFRKDFFNVYGTAREPIHYLNMEEKYEEILRENQDTFIIGIDSTFGKVKNIGSIFLDEDVLTPGAGLNKDKISIGDCSLKGIVSKSGTKVSELHNINPEMVMKLANKIVNILEKTYILFKERERINKEKIIDFNTILKNKKNNSKKIAN